MHAILVFMVFFGTYALSWVVFLFLPLGDSAVMGNILALSIALAVACVVWSRAGGAPQSVIGTAGYGAAILGALGFAAGFFGPMLLAPEANQGPLLGIFYTGPAGALLGALIGFVYGLMRTQR
jgi:hypothetical protein